MRGRIPFPADWLLRVLPALRGNGGIGGIFNGKRRVRRRPPIGGKFLHSLRNGNAIRRLKGMAMVPQIAPIGPHSAKGNQAPRLLAAIKGGVPRGRGAIPIPRRKAFLRLFRACYPLPEQRAIPEERFCAISALCASASKWDAFPPPLPPDAGARIWRTEDGGKGKAGALPLSAFFRVRRNGRGGGFDFRRVHFRLRGGGLRGGILSGGIAGGLLFGFGHFHFPFALACAYSLSSPYPLRGMGGKRGGKNPHCHSRYYSI